MREAKSGLNDVLEQPAIRTLLPDLSKLTILDLGCGAGEFSGYCVEQGASRVVAVDISEKMLEAARRENSHGRIEYARASVEEAEFVNETFDLVVSSFVMHYVQDYESAVAKIYRWLKPAGVFVFSNEHPIVLAGKSFTGWVRNSEGEKLHWAVDNYADEGRREQRWFVEGVVKYHRTVATIVNGLVGAGFLIQYVAEPLPVPESLPDRPDLIHDFRRPTILVVKAQRPPA